VIAERDDNAATLPAERLERIAEFVRSRQRASVADITAEFGVSPATARRTLAVLAERGDVQRVRGGAIMPRAAGPEPPVLQRTGEQASEKRRIGQAAAALVRDGDTVFISSGTTALEVARALAGRERLTVVTNSLPVLSMLLESPGIEVVVLGGLLRRSEQSLIGHLAELGLQEVRANRIILGIRGIHPQQGLTNDYLPETQTDRSVLAHGAQLIVVADHTKCGVVSTAWVGPISSIDVLVTDTAAPEDFVESLEAEGVEVIRA
jgi:DeoR family transcriptional regulator, aga operon transcriptional repressor